MHSSSLHCGAWHKDPDIQSPIVPNIKRLPVPSKRKQKIHHHFRWTSLRPYQPNALPCLILASLSGLSDQTKPHPLPVANAGKLVTLRGTFWSMKICTYGAMLITSAYNDHETEPNEGLLP
jgi:hypothetical protein